MRPALLSSDESAATFMMLPEAARKNLRFWHSIMVELDASPNKSKAIRLIGEKMEHLPGCDQESIRRKFYLWRRSGRRTEILVDRRRLPRTSPAKAVHHAYKTFAEENQRCSKEAHRHMIRCLCAGMELPGVGTWIDVFRFLNPSAPIPQACPWSVSHPPAGWSYSNLQRLSGLTPFEKTATRQGLVGAMDHVLPVLHTRVGLEPGQYMQFDDMWVDLELMFPGQPKPIRPLQFTCADVASGHWTAWGIRPRIRADGKWDTLKEVEFRMFLAHILCDIGYHAAGVTLMVENQTAAIRAWLEARLSSISGGLIKVERSSILTEQVHGGMFPASAKGNPKFKALIESSFNLAHNVAAALPAQTGLSPERRPESLDKLEQYCASIVVAAAKLPEADRQKLLFPALEWHSGLRVLNRLYDIKEDRHWHDLEGWEESGYMVEEFRIAGDQNWFPMSKLFEMPEHDRDIILAWLRSAPENKQVRRLSPREVYMRGRSNLRKLPICHVPDIIGPDGSFPVAVRSSGLIQFDNKYLGPGLHAYHARIETPDGYVQSLQRGANYVAYATPYHPDRLWIMNPDNGALIGYAPRYNRAAYGDEAATQILLGAQRHDLAEQAAPIRERHAPEAAALAALRAHNEAVLNPAALPDPLCVSASPCRFSSPETPEPDAADRDSALDAIDDIYS